MNKTIKEVAYEIKHHLGFFLLALATLSILFDTLLSFGYYLVLATIGLWIGHHFHINRKHYKAYELFIIYSMFLFPMVLISAATKDILSYVMIFIYIISLFTSVMIFFLHKQIIPFTRILISVVYSHVLSIAITVSFATLYAYIAPFGRIVSTTYLIFVFLLPVMFIYFLFSKYFYLHFFDRAHYKLDLAKSALHGLAFAILFVVLLSIFYIVGAAQFADIQDEHYAEILGDVRTDLQALSVPTTLSDVVSAEIQTITDQVDEEERATTKRSLMSYVTDDYFDDVQNKLTKISLFIFHVTDLRDLTKSINRNLEEGGDLEAERDSLKAEVEASWKPFIESEEVQLIKERLSLDTNSYSELMGDKLIIYQSYEAGYEQLNSLVETKSPFSRSMVNLLGHSKIFTNILRFAAEVSLEKTRSDFEPKVMKQVYDTRDTDSAILSSTIRYRVLSDHLISTQNI